jgi:hypothetical protein
MKPLWNKLLIRFGGLVAHPVFWHYLLHRVTLYILAWLLTLGGAAAALYVGWTAFDNDRRPDGNTGHTQVDFGGQYLMGRMLKEGLGRHLYHRADQRRVLKEAYPREFEASDQEKSDTENLMGWIMGQDQPTEAGIITLAAANPLEAAVFVADPRVHAHPVGGPLYPPINAFFYYPLAQFDPQSAYRIYQVVNLVLAFVAGLGITVLCEGRIWWPIASGAVLAFPGFGGSLHLAQNATLSLTILIWGWTLIARGYAGWGGLVWGLLAFKPVWALSFLLVFVLTRRWRAGLAMAATGTLLALATIPFVGLQSWFDWLTVGKEAAELYKADDNWIHLSRDLLSLPRHWLNFGREPELWYERRDDLLTTIVGWAMLVAIAEIALRLVTLRGHQAKAITGPRAAFVFLTAWLCCFHFMYYDTLLAALPVFLLFTEPRRYLKPIFLAIARIPRGQIDDKLASSYLPHLVRELPPSPPLVQLGYRNVWVLNPMEPILAVLLLASVYLFPFIGLNPWRFPYDTVCLFVFWLWCGGLWLFQSAI